MSIVCLLQALDQTLLYFMIEKMWLAGSKKIGNQPQGKVQRLYWATACVKRRVFTTMSPALPSAMAISQNTILQESNQVLSLSTKIVDFHFRREYQLHNGKYPLLYTRDSLSSIPTVVRSATGVTICDHQNSAVTSWPCLNFGCDLVTTLN